MIQLIFQGIVEWKCVALTLIKSKQLLEISGLALAVEYILLACLFEGELASS